MWRPTYLTTSKNAAGCRGFAPFFFPSPFALIEHGVECSHDMPISPAEKGSDSESHRATANHEPRRIHVEPDEQHQRNDRPATKGTHS
jgi:hypothetical protein